MNEQKTGIFNAMNKPQAFAFGIIGGVLVLCTIGFFVLLNFVLSGSPITTSDNPSLSAIEKDTAEKFSECLDTGKYASIVNADEQLGALLGVRGTPATFVNGYLVSGALPYEAIKQVVDAVLAGQEPDFDFMKDEEGNLIKADMPELENAVWKGNENAEVAVVEFSDFECPYCARFAATIETLLDNYSDKIKFTYRHFPLSFHANAQKAAEAFECAKEQGKAFEMYNELFELSKNGQLSVVNFKKAAGELGLK